MTIFSENLKAARHASNFTQEAMAIRFGVSRGAIAQWESGRTIPDANKLPEIASVLNVSLDALFSIAASGDAGRDSVPSPSLAPTWNHDMTTAPLGKEVSVTRQVTVDGEKQDRQFREHHIAPVWLAMPSGKVIRSYWIPPMKTSAGRWSGCSENEQPIAWQVFEVPAHPGIVEQGAAA